MTDFKELASTLRGYHTESDDIEAADALESLQAKLAAVEKENRGLLLMEGERNAVIAAAHALSAELAEERKRSEDERRKRVLAEAHDRQPYPTAEAYELACKARDKWQAKYEEAVRYGQAAREVAKEWLWKYKDITRGRMKDDYSEEIDAEIAAKIEGEKRV